MLKVNRRYSFGVTAVIDGNSTNIVGTVVSENNANGISSQGVDIAAMLNNLTNSENASDLSQVNPENAIYYKVDLGSNGGISVIPDYVIVASSIDELSSTSVTIVVEIESEPQRTALRHYLAGAGIPVEGL